jgi:flagellar biosynthesis chaperone FliJ
MSKLYRLEPLLKIKARARRQAEIVLGRSIGALEKEKKKKEEIEQTKEDLLQNKKDLRGELDQRVHGLSCVVGDSYRYIDFIHRIEEDVRQKDRDLEQQDEMIDDAKIVVSRSRRDYLDAANEHKVMEKHKELWSKRRDRAISMKQSKELDELGQVIHQIVQNK